MLQNKYPEITKEIMPYFYPGVAHYGPDLVNQIEKEKNIVPGLINLILGQLMDERIITEPTKNDPLIRLRM